MMFSHVSDKSKITNILLISLSNIGDVVLTLPVADILRRDFPHAKLSIVSGPKAASLFETSPVFAEYIILDKHQPRTALLRWIRALRRRRFDLVIDLRNSMIPFMLWPRYMTPPEMSKPKGMHMRRKHLERLRSVYDFGEEHAPRLSLTPGEDDRRAVRRMLGDGKPFAVMAPGSADQAKRWSVEGFAEVAKHLKKEYDLEIVFLGDQADQQITGRIAARLDHPAMDLCGRTTLIQSAEIVRRAAVAVVNDSAVLHLAGYHNVPTAGLFGYTDPVRYGPWSDQSVIIRPEGALAPGSTTEQKVAYIESIPAAAVIGRIRRQDDGKIIFQ